MSKPKTLKERPTFQSEAQERRFWETHDSADYVDWSHPRSATFPNLKLSTTTISLRLPAGLLGDLKTLANKMDVPYQSLLKVLLAESIARERSGESRVMADMSLKRTKSPPRRSQSRKR